MTDQTNAQRAADLIEIGIGNQYRLRPEERNQNIASANAYALLAIADAIRDHTPKPEPVIYRDPKLQVVQTAAQLNEFDRVMDRIQKGDRATSAALDALSDDLTALQGQDGETDSDDFPCCTGNHRGPDEVTLTRELADHMLARAETAEAERDELARSNGYLFNVNIDNHKRAEKAEAERDAIRDAIREARDMTPVGPVRHHMTAILADHTPKP